MEKAVTIALCGKGGVGKTTTAALITKILSDRGHQKILAIDADPAVGLSWALGVDVVKTVDDIRTDLIEKIKNNDLGDKSETIHMLDYEIFDALAQQDGFALLAVGRPEGEGCYCQVNNLLKEIIEDLSSRFDIVVIDGEAGVEQINRRVMKTVDHLFLLSDTSAKGINVAHTISKAAKHNKLVDYKSMGLIINRVRDNDEVKMISSKMSLPLHGYILEDQQVRNYDLTAKPYTHFPVDSKTYQAIEKILDNLGL